MANPSDRTMLKQAQAGMVGSSGFAADPLLGAVAQAHTKYYQFLVSDAATAGTAVTETAIAMPVAGKVVSVAMTAPIAVTANNTNFATVAIAKRTAAGSATAIASQTTAITGSGNLAAFVPYKFLAAAFTAANQALAADDVLTLAISKTASGVALNAATSYFTVTVGVEEI